MLFRRTKQKTPSKGRTHKPSNRGGNNSQNTANFQKQIERYSTMAKSALGDGDRSTAENFFQHADHYQRLLNDAKPAVTISDEAQKPSQQQHVRQSTSEPAPAPTPKPASEPKQDKAATQEPVPAIVTETESKPDKPRPKAAKPKAAPKKKVKAESAVTNDKLTNSKPKVASKSVKSSETKPKIATSSSDITDAIEAELAN